ncbi:MAG: ABC transporter ATP-binding protein [Bradymonadia bacterium]
MISVRNLRKEYGHLVAVKDLSFEVKKGQIVGLLGHNGAGKTTVMKVMTGFLEPTDGTILVGGKDVRTERIGVQSQIGYMPENAPLYDEMLVQEYLLMMAELRGIQPKNRKQAVIDAITATGLKDRAVQPIATLSKGYRQRVGLAQAILHRPEVLVLDEPTNGLDPVQILEIRALIKELAQTSTVIISTHILSEIEAMCNEVVILIDGELAAHSSLAKLLSAEHVQIIFNDSPSTTVIEQIKGYPSVKTVEQITVGNRQALSVTCSNADVVSGELMNAMREHQWNVNAIAPVSPSLETIFRKLMRDYADQNRERKATA